MRKLNLQIYDWPPFLSHVLALIIGAGLCHFSTLPKAGLLKIPPLSIIIALPKDAVSIDRDIKLGSFIEIELEKADPCILQTEKLKLIQAQPSPLLQASLQSGGEFLKLLDLILAKKDQLLYLKSRREQSLQKTRICDYIPRVFYGSSQ